MAMMTWPRHDLRQHQVATGWTLSTYRRADRLVRGPCMSLDHLGLELLRFDLPSGEAHEHWAPIDGRPRLYYPRRWTFDLVVDLALSNLVEHTPVVARLAGMVPPTRAELEAAARWAEPHLRPEAPPCE